MRRRKPISKALELKKAKTKLIASVKTYAELKTNIDNKIKIKKMEIEIGELKKVIELKDKEIRSLKKELGK